MNYTEETILELFKTIMKDLEINEYAKDKVDAVLLEDDKPLWRNNIVPLSWQVSSEYTDSGSYPGGALITIGIDDETSEILYFMEGPGRPIPGTLIKNDEGKYEYALIPPSKLDPLWQK